MMLTRPPKCRIVCKDEPGEVMDQLIAAFRKLGAQGLSEKDALALSRDPLRLAALFPSGSLGNLPATAQAFASSGCASCAVNKAYAPPPGKN